MFITINICLFFRGICSKLLHFMRPHSNDNISRNGLTKILDAPVHLASMAADLEDNDMEIKSIWVNSRDDSLVCLFYDHILAS